MNLLSRSALCSMVAIVAFLSPGDSGAQGADDRLRAIAREADQVLRRMSEQLRELQYRSMADQASSSGSGRVASSTHHIILDLQRGAQRVADLGTESVSRATRCDKGVLSVARDFQSTGRRLNSSTNRMTGSRARTASAATLNDVEFALQRAYNLIGTLGSVTECTTDDTEETGDDGEGTAAEEGQDEEKKKDDKGTEDYYE